MAETIDELLAAVEELTKRLTSLEHAAAGDAAALDPDAAGLAGPSPGAQENRAIRGARAELARQQARVGREELVELRRQTAALADQARQVAAATGRGSSRTAGAPPASPPEHEREGAHLAEVLDRAARALLGRPADEEDALEHTLRLIVTGAVRAVPHTMRASVLLLGKDRSAESRAPTDAVVAELDRIQITLEEGPCHTVAHEPDHVVIEDTRTEERWPRFAAAAAELGVRSVLSCHLFAERGRPAGALNLYADEPGAFDASSLDTASLYASHASLALHGARRTSGLADALRSRDVIGQAKGILAERFGLDEAQAFGMLVSSSQETNMKLRTVAEWLVAETGRQSDS